MDAGDYTTAWVVYSLAALVLAGVCWRALRQLPLKEAAWLLECWLLALLFTPWYVMPDDTIMAPALMVFVMDAVTVSMESAIRALIPLVLALLSGVLVTLVLSVASRVWQRRRNTGTPI
jgi:hypothetical protein